MKTDKELDVAFDELFLTLRGAQSYAEFEGALVEYLTACYEWDNLAASTQGLRLLPTAGLSMDYLFQFFSNYFNESFRDGSRMAEFKFFVYIEVFSHIPDELPLMEYDERVELSVWLFRFLAVESCQWMFFEMYSELEGTQFAQNWYFMLQGRK